MLLLRYLLVSVSVAHLHLFATLQPPALRVHRQLCVVHEDFVVPTTPCWAFRMQLLPDFVHPLRANPREALAANYKLETDCLERCGSDKLWPCSGHAHLDFTPARVLVPEAHHTFVRCSDFPRVALSCAHDRPLCILQLLKFKQLSPKRRNPTHHMTV